MPAPLKIQLDYEQDRTLRELSSAKGIARRVKERAMALRLSAQGWNVAKIAQYLDWAEQTVRETIHRWQQGGLGGLWEASGRGSKASWQEADWQAIQQWMVENRRYSARQISQRLADQRNIKLGEEQVRRILKKRGGVGNESVPVRLPVPSQHNWEPNR